MYTSQHGVGISKAPTVARSGTGGAQVTWNSAYTDFFGVSGPLVITAAQVSTQDVSGTVRYTLTSSQIITIVSAAEAIVTLTVWTGGI